VALTADGSRRRGGATASSITASRHPHRIGNFPRQRLKNPAAPVRTRATPVGRACRRCAAPPSSAVSVDSLATAIPTSRRRAS
jgi:hypothetical protein